MNCASCATKHERRAAWDSKQERRSREVSASPRASAWPERGAHPRRSRQPRPRQGARRCRLFYELPGRAAQHRGRESEACNGTLSGGGRRLLASCRDTAGLAPCRERGRSGCKVASAIERRRGWLGSWVRASPRSRPDGARSARPRTRRGLRTIDRTSCASRRSSACGFGNPNWAHDAIRRGMRQPASALVARLASAARARRWNGVSGLPRTDGDQRDALRGVRA